MFALYLAIAQLHERIATCQEQSAASASARATQA
jgi:hypothetical protein